MAPIFGLVIEENRLDAITLNARLRFHEAFGVSQP